MSRSPRRTILATGLAVMSAFAVAGRAAAIDVVCTFSGFNASGQSAFTSACGDYELLK